jgi:broad specificity phosphatase PhoE
MPTKHLKKLAGALITLSLATLSLTAQAEDATLDLYLARHGQTAWNLEKRLQGATDNALNDTGKAQARQLGEKLKGVGFSAVYASSLARARETAALAVPDVAPHPARPGGAQLRQVRGHVRGRPRRRPRRRVQAPRRQPGRRPGRRRIPQQPGPTGRPAVEQIRTGRPKAACWSSATAASRR